MVCLDARHAKKALNMKVNKTDANDAEGLAHLVRAGWYREVRVKGRSAMLAKALLGARGQLLNMSLSLENQIRGILKTFGRIVPKGAGGLFEKNVRAVIADDAEIAAVIMPLLQARGMARSKCAASHRGASSREKWTTTATSRGVVIASCALCFTKLPLCS
jgi:transposase